MPEQLLDFTGRVVLVTGGKSGIGRAAALAFARQGARLIIAGRSQADDTLRTIRDAGGEARFVQTDISIAAQVRHLVDATLEAYGRLDVAFNNSGLLPVTAELTEQTEEDFDQILAVDLKGLFLCMKYQIPAMLKTGGGSIVNCGSVASLIADPGMSPYVAAKHGVAGLSKAAALEYAKRNIRINTVCPGFTETEMTRGWIADPRMCEQVKSFNAVNRIASPDEIAGLVLFLASPMASFITGAVIPVDGAQTAH
ncbi:glucose 1-dehydrogenase [Martelella alba]|uniref:Glucose 1-dehydrogenase n=1 Tax=Martelella alba TaxID=2590451 RepID=A0ABY2SG86_9HYPH|nr:glucose 1-dehydrogenase [Martelella alba]TKI04101.1 glucose 1-dehydrogenase [Martelella alba]